MSKRTHFTTVTPLPAGITRETVLSTLHCHTEMIDLNPLVIERHPIKPPREASAEEINAQWYSVSDKINYIPGVYTGNLSFNACFNDLPDGLQTHILAPMGLDMRGRWTLGGTLPGEPRQPVEFGHGMPKTGLWLREDVDMKCNMVMTSFVKRTTKRTHSTLVERLIEKSHIKEAEGYNNTLKEQLELRNQYPPDYHSDMVSPAPAPYPLDGKPPLQHAPSVSDGGSIRSGGSMYDPRGSMHDPRSSIHDPRNSYPSTQLPIEHHYQQYPPVPTYATPQPRPQAGTNKSYPPIDAQHNPPYPMMPPPLFAAELPSQEAKTPIELAESGRPFQG